MGSEKKEEASSIEDGFIESYWNWEVKETKKKVVLMEFSVLTFKSRRYVGRAH